MCPKRTFVRGAVILAFTGIVARVIGAAMRIILAALMGDEGIGLYQMAYPVYVTLLTISTAGVPVAISKLVAEKLALNDHRGAHQIYRLSMIMLTVSGLVIFFILAAGANYFAVNIARDPRAYLPILAISPAIFFVTVMSAMRGLFQGHQNMVPTAWSQFFEQLVRVITAIILTILLLRVSLEHAAAGAAFGAATGGLAGLLVVIIIYYRQKADYSQKLTTAPPGDPVPTAAALSRIVSLSVPVTLGTIMAPLISMLDLIIVPTRLHQAGFDTTRATALYGQLTGMALPLVLFPSVILVALTISLVPAISEAYALKDSRLLQNRVETSNRFTILFAFPAAIGLFLLSLGYLNNAVTMLLYDNAEAAYPLSILAWMVIFMSFYLTTTGILQGIGFPLIPVINMFIGVVVKVVITWVLTGIPAVHVGGAALGTVVGFLLVTILNMCYVCKLTGYRFNAWNLLARPVISILAMSLVVVATYRGVFELASNMASFQMANAVATLLCITAGMIVYFVLLMLTGWLRENDLKELPRIGTRIAAVAVRAKILKS